MAAKGPGNMSATNRLVQKLASLCIEYDLQERPSGEMPRENLCSLGRPSESQTSQR
jgi:hypothetical protein